MLCPRKPKTPIGIHFLLQYLLISSAKITFQSFANQKGFHFAWALKPVRQSIHAGKFFSLTKSSIKIHAKKKIHPHRNKPKISALELFIQMEGRKKNVFINYRNDILLKEIPNIYPQLYICNEWREHYFFICQIKTFFVHSSTVVKVTWPQNKEDKKTS